MESHKPTFTFHLVVMPYPGRGHINPMINLCKLISSKTPALHLLRISFVVTEEWAALLQLQPDHTLPHNLSIVSMPNVVPSELGRGSNPIEFFEAVCTRMEAPFERLLDGLGDPPPSLLLSDSVLTWAIPLANRRNIPVASLFPMSAAVLSQFKSLLDKDGHSPPDAPGAMKRIQEAISRLFEAQYLLLSTVYELETEDIESLREELPCPVYTVGPLIKRFDLQSTSSATAVAPAETDYFKWLDGKADDSVLFVSLGSYLLISREQMDELGAGLLEADVPFLWVVRGETQKTCGDRGLVVPWCDQLRVLCHPAVGGFLSHCGWNSVQEGIYAAVPFITFPLGAEQFLNSKQITEDWKTGYGLKESETESAVVIKREEISRLANKLMKMDCQEGKRMRMKMRELQGLFHQAVSEGGSTTTNINAFISNSKVPTI